ncbi:MAG: hypothetical protein OXS29_08490 [bacterium]|nr:hypothetical protein [bacterium]MDE0289813.1 hypothetical protein [bacterium]MDE0436886.1 hypothetical protein [bacterium]
MPDQLPDGFDLERVLTLMQNDIGVMKGDVRQIRSDVADLKTGQGTLIDSIADTTTRVVELERTQHEH